MFEAVRELADHASERVVGMLYGLYADEHDLYDRTKEPIQITHEEVRYPLIPLSALDETQRAQWELYLQTARPSREFAVNTVGLLRMTNLPDPAKVYDTNIHPELHALQRSNYQIVTSVLPDITDEEAKKLFGGATLTQPETKAEDVHQRADPETRYFEQKCINCKLQNVDTTTLFDPTGNSRSNQE